MTVSRRLAAAEAVLGEPAQDVVVLLRYRRPVLVLTAIIGVMIVAINLGLASTPGYVRFVLIGLVSGVVLALGTEPRALASADRGLTLLRVSRMRNAPTGVIRSVDPSDVSIDAAGFTARVSIEGEEHRVAPRHVEQVRGMCHPPEPSPASSDSSGGDITV